MKDRDYDPYLIFTISSATRSCASAMDSSGGFDFGDRTKRLPMIKTYSAALPIEVNTIYVIRTASTITSVTSGARPITKR